MKVNYSNKAVPWGISNNCCSYLRVLMGAHTYSELKLGNYQWQGFFSICPLGPVVLLFACLLNFNLVLSCYLTYFTFLCYLNILYYLCVFTLMFFETVWLQFAVNTKDHLSCFFIHKIKTSVLDCIEVGRNIFFDYFYYYYYYCCVL